VEIIPKGQQGVVWGRGWWRCGPLGWSTIVGKYLDFCGQDSVKWVWVMLLAGCLPRRVDVKGGGAGAGCMAHGWVQVDCKCREVGCLERYQLCDPRG